MSTFEVSKGIIKKVFETVINELSQERKKKQWEEKEKLSYEIVKYYEELDVELKILDHLVNECKVNVSEILSEKETYEVVSIEQLRNACTEEDLLKLDSRRLDLLIENLQGTKKYIEDITLKINAYAERKWILNKRMEKVKK